MIVSTKMMVDAEALLRGYLTEDQKERFHANLAGDLRPEMVKTMYNCAALVAHPDRGGTLEAFAAVDRAKHVLLKYLERTTVAQPEAPHPYTVCHTCGGKGYVTVQRAFRASRQTCPGCHGLGELRGDKPKEAFE